MVIRVSPCPTSFPLKTPVAPVRLSYNGSSRPDCANCPLALKHDRGIQTPYFVPGEIRPGKILFLGEAPGEEEVRQGIPFAPSNPLRRPNAGRVLWGVLEDLGITRDMVSVTNVLKCRPPQNKFHLAGQRAVKACASAFLAELELADPHAIVAVGAEALHATAQNLSKSKLSELRGHLLPSRFKSQVLPIYHPAYFLRSHEQRVLDSMYDDLEKLFPVNGQPISEPSFSVDQIKRIPETAVIDIEISKAKGKISCLGFSPLDKELISIVTDPVSLKHTKRLIGHFVKSDFIRLREEGWIPESWNGELWDTILLAQLDGTSREHWGLKSFAAEYDFPIYWEAVRRAWKAKPPHDPEDHALWRYNAQDVALTRRLCLDYRGRVDSSVERRRYFDRFLVQALRLTAELELNGVQLSPDIPKATEQIKRRIRYREDKIRGALSLGKEENLNGSKLKRSLYERLGIDPERLTPTGLPAFDRVSLEKVLPLDRSGVLKRYFELSVLEKQRQQITQLLPYAGRIIHPQFNLGGKGDKDWREEGASPVTGRLSSEDPNMQQFPPWLRRYIISRYPDGYILKWDAKQIEIRTAYCYSRDPAFLRRDLHEYTAGLMSRTLGRKFSRQEGKLCNFAVLYGAEASRLEREFNLSANHASELRQALRDEFGTHFDYLDEVRRETRRSGCVRSLTGRVWALPRAQAGDPHALNQAINYPNQNLASDLNTLAAAALGWKGDGWRMWNLVHDEGGLDCESLSVAKQVGRQIVSYWRDELPRDVEEAFGLRLPIPFEVELKVGKNWLDMEPLAV